jgi:hypothetical protein
MECELNSPSELPTSPTVRPCSTLPPSHWSNFPTWSMFPRARHCRHLTPLHQNYVRPCCTLLWYADNKPITLVWFLCSGLQIMNHSYFRIMKFDIICYLRISTNNIAIGLVRVHKIRFRPTNNTLSSHLCRNIFLLVPSSSWKVEAVAPSPWRVWWSRQPLQPLPEQPQTHGAAGTLDSLHKTLHRLHEGIPMKEKSNHTHLGGKIPQTRSLTMCRRCPRRREASTQCLLLLLLSLHGTPYQADWWVMTNTRDHREREEDGGHGIGGIGQRRKGVESSWGETVGA